MLRKTGMSGSEGGRRKRTSSAGTSSAAYPTLRTVPWEPGLKRPGRPDPAQADRTLPTASNSTTRWSDVTGVTFERSSDANQIPEIRAVARS